MKLQELEFAVERQLRVRDPKPARQLAKEVGVSVKALALPLARLVADGRAVKGPRPTVGGDRAPRYTKPSAAKG